MWKYYALLSALFAKIGIKDVNSDLVTARRTSIIVLLTWGIILFCGVEDKIKDISLHSWIFLILSVIVTGCSWLFYFNALQNGEVPHVAPIDKLSVPLIVFMSFIILKGPISFRTIAS